MLLVHECTPRFQREILQRHLGDLYNFVGLPTDTISPHQIGPQLQSGNRGILKLERNAQIAIASRTTATTIRKMAQVSNKDDRYCMMAS